MVSSSSETPLVDERCVSSWFTSTDWLADWPLAVWESTPSAAICCAYWSPMVTGPGFVVTDLPSIADRVVDRLKPDTGADNVRRAMPVSTLMIWFVPVESSPTVMVAGVGGVVPGLTVTVGGAPATTLNVYLVFGVAPDRSRPSNEAGTGLAAGGGARSPVIVAR